jgi:hypothetical protein
MELVDLEELGSLAVSEYPSLVRTFSIIDNKLRILLTDNSFIDFWWSTQLPGRYAHHWERRHVDGTIYRHDNAPHAIWEHLQTFPHHFHFKTDRDVRVSNLSLDPKESVREFLAFASHLLTK